MPQMAPISWLMLFFMFSITFIMFSIINYYSFINQTSKSNYFKNKMINSFNWKW